MKILIFISNFISDLRYPRIKYIIDKFPYFTLYIQYRL